MSDSSEVKLHFLDYWRVIRVRWGLVLLTFLLVMVSAGVTCWFLPREYFSKATIEVKPERNKVIDVFKEGSGAGSSSNFMATQFQVIQKKEILYPVIERLKLQEKWTGGGPQLPKLEAYNKLMRKLSLNTDRGTDLINVGVFDTDAQEAADIANTIAAIYVEKRKSGEGDSVTKALLQLDESINAKRRDVEDKRAKATKLRLDNNITDPDPENLSVQDVTYGTVQRLETAAQEARLEVGKLTTQLQQIDAAKPEELPVLLETIQMPNPTVTHIVAAKQEAAIELPRLMNAGLGENHPKVKSLREQVEVYTRQLADQIEAVRNALHGKLTIAQSNLQDIENKLDTARKKFTQDKNVAASYYEAKNDYILSKKLLEAAATNYSTEVMKTGIDPNPAIIHEKAEKANLPSRPNIPTYMVLAAVVGLIAGVGLAFFIEYLDTSVKTLDDVERYLGVPVLAIVPKDVGILFNQAVDPPDAEAYRILRTNIEFNRKNPDANSITIISGGAGEGKSTTLCNLAYTCARGGYSVLLIDADLRRPSLHKYLGMDNSVGLTNYLTSKMDYGEVVRPTSVENLSFIPSGILPSDAVGILNSQRMVDLIATVKTKYDLVFFDSPPILGVSDASILASSVDITVMCIQHRRFPRSMLQRVKQTVLNVGGNLLGVVLNNVDTKQDSGYQYYTSYYDYYTPKEEKKGPTRHPHPPGKVPVASQRPGQTAEY